MPQRANGPNADVMSQINSLILNSLPSSARPPSGRTAPGGKPRLPPKAHVEDIVAKHSTMEQTIDQLIIASKTSKDEAARTEKKRRHRDKDREVRHHAAQKQTWEHPNMHPIVSSNVDLKRRADAGKETIEAMKEQIHQLQQEVHHLQQSNAAYYQATFNRSMGSVADTVPQQQQMQQQMQSLIPSMPTTVDLPTALIFSSMDRTSPQGSDCREAAGEPPEQDPAAVIQIPRLDANIFALVEEEPLSSLHKSDLVTSDYTEAIATVPPPIPQQEQHVHDLPAIDPVQVKESSTLEKENMGNENTSSKTNTLNVLSNVTPKSFFSVNQDPVNASISISSNNYSLVSDYSDITISEDDIQRTKHLMETRARYSCKPTDITMDMSVEMCNEQVRDVDVTGIDTTMSSSLQMTALSTPLTGSVLSPTLDITRTQILPGASHIAGTVTPPITTATIVLRKVLPGGTFSVAKKMASTTQLFPIEPHDALIVTKSIRTPVRLSEKGSNTVVLSAVNSARIATADIPEPAVASSTTHILGSAVWKMDKDPIQSELIVTAMPPVTEQPLQGLIIMQRVSNAIKSASENIQAIKSLTASAVSSSSRLVPSPQPSRVTLTTSRNNRAASTDTASPPAVRSQSATLIRQPTALAASHSTCLPQRQVSFDSYGPTIRSCILSVSRDVDVDANPDADASSMVEHITSSAHSMALLRAASRGYKEASVPNDLHKFTIDRSASNPKTLDSYVFPQKKAAPAKTDDQTPYSVLETHASVSTTSKPSHSVLALTVTKQSILDTRQTTDHSSKNHTRLSSQLLPLSDFHFREEPITPDPMPVNERSSNSYDFTGVGGKQVASETTPVAVAIVTRNVKTAPKMPKEASTMNVKAGIASKAPTSPAGPIAAATTRATASPPDRPALIPHYDIAANITTADSVPTSSVTRPAFRHRKESSIINSFVKESASVRDNVLDFERFTASITPIISATMARITKADQHADGTRGRELTLNEVFNDPVPPVPQLKSPSSPFDRSINNTGCNEIQYMEMPFDASGSIPAIEGVKCIEPAYTERDCSKTPSIGTIEPASTHYRTPRSHGQSRSQSPSASATSADETIRRHRTPSFSINQSIFDDFAVEDQEFALVYQELVKDAKESRTTPEPGPKFNELVHHNVELPYQRAQHMQAIDKSPNIAASREDLKGPRTSMVCRASSSLESKSVATKAVKSAGADSAAADLNPDRRLASPQQSVNTHELSPPPCYFTVQEESITVDGISAIMAPVDRGSIKSATADPPVSISELGSLTSSLLTPNRVKSGQNMSHSKRINQALEIIHDIDDELNLDATGIGNSATSVDVTSVDVTSVGTADTRLSSKTHSGGQMTHLLINSAALSISTTPMIKKIQQQLSGAKQFLAYIEAEDAMVEAVKDRISLERRSVDETGDTASEATIAIARPDKSVQQVKVQPTQDLSALQRKSTAYEFYSSSDHTGSTLPGPNPYYSRTSISRLDAHSSDFGYRGSIERHQLPTLSPLQSNTPSLMRSYVKDAQSANHESLHVENIPNVPHSFLSRDSVDRRAHNDTPDPSHTAQSYATFVTHHPELFMCYSDSGDARWRPSEHKQILCDFRGGLRSTDLSPAPPFTPSHRTVKDQVALPLHGFSATEPKPRQLTAIHNPRGHVEKASDAVQCIENVDESSSTSEYEEVIVSGLTDRYEMPEEQKEPLKREEMGLVGSDKESGESSVTSEAVEDYPESDERGNTDANAADEIVQHDDQIIHEMCLIAAEKEAYNSMTAQKNESMINQRSIYLSAVSMITDPSVCSLRSYEPSLASPPPLPHTEINKSSSHLEPVSESLKDIASPTTAMPASTSAVTMSSSTSLAPINSGNYTIVNVLRPEKHEAVSVINNAVQDNVNQGIDATVSATITAATHDKSVHGLSGLEVDATLPLYNDVFFLRERWLAAEEDLRAQKLRAETFMAQKDAMLETLKAEILDRKRVPEAETAVSAMRVKDSVLLANNVSYYETEEDTTCRRRGFCGSQPMRRKKPEMARLPKIKSVPTKSKLTHKSSDKTQNIDDAGSPQSIVAILERSPPHAQPETEKTDTVPEAPKKREKVKRTIADIFKPKEKKPKRAKSGTGASSQGSNVSTQGSKLGGAVASPYVPVTIVLSPEVSPSPPAQPVTADYVDDITREMWGGSE